MLEPHNLHDSWQSGTDRTQNSAYVLGILRHSPAFSGILCQSLDKKFSDKFYKYSAIPCKVVTTNKYLDVLYLLDILHTHKCACILLLLQKQGVFYSSTDHFHGIGVFLFKKESVERYLILSKDVLV